MLIYELSCRSHVGELNGIRGGKADVPECTLRVSAIVFKAGTIGTAAYYVETVAP